MSFFSFHCLFLIQGINYFKSNFWKITTISRLWPVIKFFPMPEYRPQSIVGPPKPLAPAGFFLGGTRSTKGVLEMGVASGGCGGRSPRTPEKFSINLTNQWKINNLLKIIQENFRFFQIFFINFIEIFAKIWAKI